MQPKKDDGPFRGSKIALFCGEYLVTYLRDDRPGIPFPGFWDLPGGGREGEESPVECALRELHEEFAITLPAGRIRWLKKHVPPTGLPSYFLAAEVTTTELARVRFGSEGQRWKMMRAADFLTHPEVAPPLKVRLAEYLQHCEARREEGETTGEAPPLKVSALFRDRLSVDVAEFRPTHVVSLLDPALPLARIPKFPAGARVLQRHFFDGDSPSEQPPDEAVVRDILEFLADWLEAHRARQAARLLVHCHMGASRSAAVAMLALALQHEPGRESEAFVRGLALMNKPWPNLNVIKLADQQLGRDGALLEPLLAYRARYPRRLQAYGRLNRRRGVG